MKSGERPAFIVAGVLFAIFLGNIVLGAARVGTFLSDVGEMLLLFGACIFFVVAVLVLERRNKEANNKIQNGGNT